jgi:hypothetical protein
MQVDLVKIGTEIIAGASLLYTLIPPWEQFGDYPTFQKTYKFFILFLKAASLNARSAVYQSISTQSGTSPSPAATGTAADKASGKTVEDINQPAAGGK